MKEFEQVEVNSRAELRAWLAENHTRTESIWLITYKKHVSDKYVSWDDIVQEVLCVGWIDSLPRKLDADRSMLRLSPRRPGSPWSRRNKKHIEKMVEAGLMKPPGLAAIARAKQDGSWSIYDEVEDMVIPPDLAQALGENTAAAENFYAFSDSAKKGILWWLKSAKRDNTRRQRIDETTWLAAHNICANTADAQAFKRQNKPANPPLKG